MNRFAIAKGCAAMAAAMLPILVCGCPPPVDSQDAELRALLASNGAQAIEKPPTDAAKVRLGQSLFFDNILSGNRNISCATCHHPALFTGDARSLPSGEGGEGLGNNRTAPLDGEGNPIFIARNSTDLFNRASFHTMFWDGRVEQLENGSFATPAGDAVLPGLDSALAAQAMFPVASRDEMRGQPGDNELADIGDDGWQAIWEGLMTRLLGIQEYSDLFAEAFPGVAEADLTFAHAANAIAEFEVENFTLPDSPFDRYLRGDNAALNVEQKTGMDLFFRRFRCSECHNGPLLTNELYHDIGVVQIGPGKGDGMDGTWDYGRERVTEIGATRFQFRTPPLRNVAATAPYMHDGSIATLEGVVDHYDDVFVATANYDPAQLTEPFRDLVRAEQTGTIVGRLDFRIQALGLTDIEADQLVVFMQALTDPAIFGMVFNSVPERVPSGLPVAGN